MSEPATTQPMHGEWWVCCYSEDAERMGGAGNVPASARLVAYLSHLGDTPRWELTGSGEYERHWLTPIRKVEL